LPNSINQVFHLQNCFYDFLSLIFDLNLEIGRSVNLSKNIVFIGTRFNVLEQLLKTEGQNLIKIYALENSFLAAILDENKLSYHAFGLEDKQRVISELINTPFDIMISNGCPFILPTGKFSEQQTLINVHPTYLPFLKGKTPLNGIFYENYNFYGATMHYMDEGIDTGAIIYREKKTLTPDIDLGLLYYLAMKLEGTVFAKGWKKLKASNYAYIGKKQEAEGSYFNRTPEMQQLDFAKDSNEHLLRCIKSFGIGSQGCMAQLDKVVFVIYAAEEIVHKPLLKQFEKVSAGAILVEYDEKFLVKTRQGIIKITSYRMA
jgi:methionyl-tRNA formyltransferase